MVLSVSTDIRHSQPASPALFFWSLCLPRNGPSARLEILVHAAGPLGLHHEVEMSGARELLAQRGES